MRLRAVSAIGALFLALRGFGVAGCAAHGTAVSPQRELSRVEIDSALAPRVIAGVVLDIENDVPVQSVADSLAP
jgi:hypothetical protein